MGTSGYKMLSLNVRGLSNFKKRRAIFAWCRKQNTNIIFLQETHSTHEKEKQWKAEWGAPLELAHGSSNARGVATLLLNGFDRKIKQKIIDPMGRNLGIEAEINDGKYLLLNVYGPNNNNEAANLMITCLMKVQAHSYKKYIRFHILFLVKHMFGPFNTDTKLHFVHQYQAF